MTFNEFLEKIKIFLETGTLDLPGKECQVSDTVYRLAQACSLFEREKYKRLGSISEGQVRFFCINFSHTLFSIPSSEFEVKLLSLDSRSRDFILRGIEYSSATFPSLDFSEYSKFL